jgi:hypothetical protein
MPEHQHKIVTTLFIRRVPAVDSDETQLKITKELKQMKCTSAITLAYKNDLSNIFARVKTSPFDYFLKLENFHGMFFS